MTVLTVSFNCCLAAGLVGIECLNEAHIFYFGHVAIIIVVAVADAADASNPILIPVTFFYCSCSNVIEAVALSHHLRWHLAVGLNSAVAFV